MPAGAQQLSRRLRRPPRRTLWLLGGLLAACGIVAGVDRLAFQGGGRPPRPELQRVLDDLVAGGDAPGATAYVTGPHGTWLGSAGVADIRSKARMPADARMRIESNSKTWLVAVILQLAQEGRLSLDDSVERWLPGLLRDHGPLITIRQLLHDAGGLIDDNDLYQATPAGLRADLARIGDLKLRAQAVAAAARLRANPLTARVPALLFIRIAAWQPLVAEPGTTYHHSNIGWNVAGLIAARAGGKPLPVLYRERLFRPLGLRHTAFAPQGPIPVAHAEGYAISAGGRLTDTTAMHPGKAADGAIVTDAHEEAIFLRALMDGTLVNRNQVDAAAAAAALRLYCDA